MVHNKTVSRLLIISIITAIILSAQLSIAKSVRIYRKHSGSFLTNVVGSSVTEPPYIQVIRSRDGFDHFISKYERLKNRTTQRRIDKLRSNFYWLDYRRYMIIGIFTKPMDNYELKLNRIDKSDDGKVIEAHVTYKHKVRAMHIPPKKSVHYIMVAVKKSNLPVLLLADTKENNGKKKPNEQVTVTGRLMTISGSADLQLVPTRIKRGNKDSYFIKGDQAESLRKHAGKVVTLRGTVSHETDSPYEWDLTVDDVKKVYR